MIPIIHFKSYSVNYGEKTVLKDLNLSLSEKKSYAAIGPSGCGKTTMIYSIAGLLPDTARSSGTCIVQEDKTMATMLQAHGLLPWKTVYDNITLPLTLKGKAHEGVEALMERLGIDQLQSHYPHEISGGQQQRTALARAVVGHSELLLMDEPFSSVDVLTKEKLQQTLKDLVRDKAMTLFLVTHDIEEAVFLAEEILMMNPQGEVIERIENKAYQANREDEKFYKACIAIRKRMRGDLI